MVFRKCIVEELPTTNSNRWMERISREKKEKAVEGG